MLRLKGRGRRVTIIGSRLLLNYEIAVLDSHLKAWKWLVKGFYSQGKMHPRGVRWEKSGLIVIIGS